MPFNYGAFNKSSRNKEELKDNSKRNGEKLN